MTYCERLIVPRHPSRADDREPCRMPEPCELHPAASAGGPLHPAMPSAAPYPVPSDEDVLAFVRAFTGGSEGALFVEAVKTRDLLIAGRAYMAGVNRGTERMAEILSEGETKCRLSARVRTTWATTAPVGTRGRRLSSHPTT